MANTWITFANSSKPLLIDLFAGRLGWSKGFIAKGWRVQAYDINRPNIEIPAEVDYRQFDVLALSAADLMGADFICASSPCEEFSVHCMKHFHPNPKYPELGIRLFEHTRAICEASGLPYVMENVRCAEKFVGRAVNHCGPFYLWGNAVPAVMPRHVYRVRKGVTMGLGNFALMTPEQRREARKGTMLSTSYGSAQRDELTAKAAEIPLSISEYIAQCANELVIRTME